MARFTAKVPPPPIGIHKWLGMNEAVGMTDLALGETLRQTNFRITKDYKPQKREGHNTFINFGNSSPVRNIWKGTLGGRDTTIIVQGGYVWRDFTISGIGFSSLSTTNLYTDVIRTIPLPEAITTVAFLRGDTQFESTTTTEGLDNVGKVSFDGTELNIVVDKGKYADILEARADLGTMTAYYRIGELTDGKVAMVYFNSKLLFFNGEEYKEYNGTTYQDVVPYEPTKYIALAPDLSNYDVGNVYEQENLLTGRKWIEYQGDGTATVYQIPEIANLDAELVLCTVNGTTKTETTDFTVDRTVPKLTFSVAPANKSIVRIRVKKTYSENKPLVTRNYYATTFGPGNDTSIFLWGNPFERNRRTWCAPMNEGYFPVFNFTLIGTDEHAITDIKTAGANYQIIFKEDRTHYSPPEYIPETKTYDYPVYDLNEAVGNVTKGGVQIINNNALSLQNNSWWLWNSTNVQDERNVSIVSDRLGNSLSELDLKTAVTFDYQSLKEYWCNVGDKVYIWNYGNNTMYIFDNITANCFIEMDGLYYGGNGTIEKLDGLDDNGVAVNATMETGFYSFGGMNLLKTSDTLYVSILPDSKTSVTLYFRTNKINESKQIRKTANYNLFDLDDFDLDDFSLSTNINPQPFVLEFSSGDYSYIQFIFENKEISETCTILDFLIKAEVQGEL